MAVFKMTAMMTIPCNRSRLLHIGNFVVAFHIYFQNIWLQQSISGKIQFLITCITLSPCPAHRKFSSKIEDDRLVNGGHFSHCPIGGYFQYPIIHIWFPFLQIFQKERRQFQTFCSTYLQASSYLEFNYTLLFAGLQFTFFFLKSESQWKQYLNY